MHVWLIGMMGSGKSAVAKVLAAKSGMRVLDLDREVERAARASIPSIFRDRGERAFRTLEARALARAASSRRPAVIATGGGAVLSATNVEAMRETGRIVWLDAPVGVLAKRVRGSARPLLKERGALARLHAERRPLYASAADLRIDAAAGDPGAVAGRVRESLDALAAPVRYRVDDRTTVIHAGAGLLARAGALVREAAGGEAAIVVTDRNVGRLHGRGLVRSLSHAGYRVRTLTIPAGERHKTAATMDALWNGLVRAGIDRKTVVIALGGGVVGDLAGFAAATILRGVPFAQVPTTVVAQVDSAIGGKTGFDLSAGKNLVGAFKQPVVVVADTRILETLPPEEARAGLAEVVKYGVIADEALFALLERAERPFSPAVVERLVRRSVEIKAAVVEADPLEHGRRVILNYGHTAGHALEAASRYRVRHGEAVAAGMLAEAELAWRLGACASADVERLARLLARLDLPLTLPVKGAERFLASDKKRIGAKVRLPLLTRIGAVDIREIRLHELRSLFRSKGRTQ